MSDTMAIKTFLEAGPLGLPVTTKELMEFKRACTAQEWHQFAIDAAEALGAQLKLAA